MKKYLVIAIVLMLAVPAVSMAAVSATPHDMSVAAGGAGLLTAGICSPCHIPHGAAGDRLFPDAGPGGTGGGTVGQLCAYCHFSGGGANAALGVDMDSDGYVYHTESHGNTDHMLIADHPDQDNTYLVASGLPYTNDVTYTSLECTSCHNVHDNTTAAPFLRSSVNDLCQKCHDYRHWDGAAFNNTAMGAWGGAIQGTNPGSHPVGTDVTDAMNINAVTDITSGEFNVAFEAAFNWQSGGHLSGGDSGGVVCTSCHAVHGQWSDATAVGFPATEGPPNSNFLAVGQTGTNETYTTPITLTRDIASGYGAQNYLCEECHNTSADAANGGNYATVGGDTAFDPGTTGYTHPLDGIVPSDDGWVTAFPAFGVATWPAGGGFNTGMGPVAICESCHVTHPLANNHPAAPVAIDRGDVVATAGVYEYILRDDGAGICDNCHTGDISGHHPIGMNYDSSGVDGVSTTPLIYVTGAAGDTLSCRTCHAASGAHNWATADGIGLDPNWLPLDNGRDFVTPATDAVNADMSVTCMNCHFELDSDATRYSPTLPGGANNDAGSVGWSEIGDGTHYMGGSVRNADVLEQAIGAGSLNPNLTDVYITAGLLWPNTIPGASGSGWSRFQAVGTGAPIVLVCESCHELEPDKNNYGAGGFNLLLADYSDGTNGAGGAVAGRDSFCESCHMPEGTHPMTGDVPDRTSVTLDIVPQDWLKVPPAGNGAINVTWTPATDYMSCDSCHQPHDANSASANMILEAGEDVPNMLPVNDTSNAPDATGLVNYYDNTSKGPNHQEFCQHCHGY